MSWENVQGFKKDIMTAKFESTADAKSALLAFGKKRQSLLA